MDVRQWFEPGQSKFYPDPILFFRGDKNQGEKAVKILQGHGVKVFELRRMWHYGGREHYDEVLWELTT
jgi:hypothetical protein